jgi:hypothetical protein
LTGEDFDRLCNRAEQDARPAKATEIKDSRFEIGQFLPANGAAFEPPRDGYFRLKAAIPCPVAHDFHSSVPTNRNEDRRSPAIGKLRSACKLPQ